MGLTSHSARAGDSCRSLILDCTTDEDEAIPGVWSCFSRNEFGIFQGLLGFPEWMRRRIHAVASLKMVPSAQARFGA